MQRPLGEPLRGRARIERFDRDLLRIERRIERKLVAGVGEAKKSKPRSEHQGPHREASCYDRAVLTARMVVAVIALALRRGAGYPQLFLLRIPPTVVGALRAVSVGVFFVLIAAGLFGTQDPFRNLAPAFVWIAWWIGFTYLSALLGDFWALLNPWKVFYPKGIFELPPAIGVWPAAALFLAFAWIEIVWEGNAVPANIAWLAL